MIHLRKFNEMRLPNLPYKGEDSNDSISIFNQEWFEKLLPETLEIVNNGQIFTLKKNDCTLNFDLCQFNYWQSSLGDNNVLENGEPSSLEFDLHFHKNDNGIKINVDITYGDQMISEFSIESPNKINVIHYNGVNSKYDPKTHFGFTDKSIEYLVNFFNSFNHGISITAEDLSFIDEHMDSYDHNINNKDHYYTDDSKLMNWGNSLNKPKNEKIILVIDNSKPPEKKYLPKVVEYLKTREIPFKVASKPEEVEVYNKNYSISGAISTGSDFRVSSPQVGELDTSNKALDILECPILGFCYGFQSMAKFYGSKIGGGELTDDCLLLDSFDSDHPLFAGVDLEKQPVTFCFHGYPMNCPKDFSVIATIDEKIAGISKHNRYGLLFHPEELQETCSILDNFMKMCKSDIKMTNVVEKYSEFVKKYRK